MNCFHTCGLPGFRHIRTLRTTQAAAASKKFHTYNPWSVVNHAARWFAKLWKWFAEAEGGEEMMHNAVQWQWYAMQKWWHAICETSCKAATLSPCQTWDSPLSTHGEKGRCASVVQLCISLMSFAKISQINYLRLWFRCATYPSDVWIYHTYMNTHMIYH